MFLSFPYPLFMTDIVNVAAPSGPQNLHENGSHTELNADGKCKYTLKVAGKNACPVTGKKFSKFQKISFVVILV
jgi:hypothetical protein